MTTRTNAAILLAARDVEVTCGACRRKAHPARVLGIAVRIVSERHAAIVSQVSSVVEYRCGTPSCDAPAIPCEVVL